MNAPTVSATGLTVTVLHTVDGERVLERRRGAFAPSWPRPGVPAGLATLPGTVPAQWPSEDHAVHRLGPVQDNPHLFGVDRPPTPAQLSTLVRTVRLAHALDPADADRTAPDFVRRVLTWHCGEVDEPLSARALQLRQQVVAHLGERRLADIVAVGERWSETDEPTLVHGFASLGNAVGDVHGTSRWLLSGHHRRGPAEVDLGVLLSDAFELGLGPDLDLPDGLDESQIMLWGRFRLLSHVVDHVLFAVQEPADLLRYLDVLAHLADTPELLRTRAWSVAS